MTSKRLMFISICEPSFNRSVNFPTMRSFTNFKLEKLYQCFMEPNFPHKMSRYEMQTVMLKDLHLILWGNLKF